MAPSSSSSPPPPPEDLEWEEWDSRTSPLSFPHHCLAGSFAGVAEHTLLYPLDTVKTCWQSQVLHRASATAAGATAGTTAGGGGAAASASGCASSGSCGIFTMGHVQNIIMPGSIDGNIMENKSSLHSTPQTSSTSSSTTANSIASSSTKSQHGIWSTMKHLMQQGHHHHHHHPTQHHHLINPTLINLAGNPPNVVDLTTAKNASSYHNGTASSATASASSSSSSSSSSKQQIIIKRPWSKHGRILRNATLQDITAHGMIRASSSSVGGAAILSSSGFITNNTSTSTTSTTINTAATNTAGIKRLWRGVQSMFVGCIPAHALYFSSYELIKSVCTDGGGYHAHQHHHHQQQQQQQQQHRLGEEDSSQYNSMVDDDDNMSMTHQFQQQHHQQHQYYEQGHVGHDTLSPTQAMLAGGIATLLHDFVMTPMDTMKQRMQLGHYDNLRHAFVSIVWGDGSRGNGAGVGGGGGGGEGWRGLYRSFPITVMTNVPYGMIMMTTNEWLRGVLEDGLYGRHHEEDNEETNPFHFTTILLSGMGAGGIASAITAPLDRVKTRLQTQRMGMVLPSHYTVGGGGGANSSTPTTASRATTLAIMEERVLAAAQGNPKVCPKMAVQDVKSTLFPSSAAIAASSTTSSASIPLPRQPLMATATQTYYSTPFEAFQSIVQEEGLRGLFRGTLPRVALHAPSVAISWTAYEMAKDWLIWSQQQ